MKFAGSVALVTGAGGGIGSALGERFHDAGATVVLSDRAGADVEAVVERLNARRPGSAHAVIADVAHEEQNARLVSQARQLAGRIDLFFANAGVGLGTDGPMSGNTLDLIGQFGYVAKVHKLDRKDRNVMPAIKVVEMATLGGARAIHREADLGSLEPGKLADVIIIDHESTAMMPLFDVYSALVYAASPRDVRTTIIHGQVVMENRQLLTVDTAEVRAKMRDIMRRINAAVAAGLK